MTDPLYDITGIKLAEVEKPAQKGRDPLPNPLLDLIKTRKVGDKAARFSIPFGSLDIAEKRRKAILRDLTRSGQELGHGLGQDPLSRVVLGQVSHVGDEQQFHDHPARLHERKALVLT